MAISKSGINILNLEDWEKLGGPKSPSQWVDGRSAKEAAKAWLSGAGGLLPHEVNVALSTHPDFGSVCTWEAEPEVRLRCDSFRGEPRNSDLVVHAEDAHGKYLIAVEAKADEPFGDTVKITRERAKERLQTNPRSNGVKRVDNLVHDFFWLHI